MSKLTRDHILSTVSSAIKEETLSKIQNYVEANEPKHLWGSEKPRSFLHDMVLLTLYKDIENVGLHSIANKINFNYKITDHSLFHNIPLIRAVVGSWAESEIKVGNYFDWKSAARHCSFGPLVADTVLWIDSTDFHIVNTNRFTPSSEHWSYKENCCARRFMVISDAKSRASMVWRGNIPNLKDTEFLNLLFLIILK